MLIVLVIIRCNTVNTTSFANVSKDDTNTDVSTTEITLNIGSKFVNVKSYGAKGNGASDDTTAIQNALDALDGIGGICYFPEGIYMINRTLVIPSSVHVMGDSVSVPIIKPTPKFQTDMINGTIGEHISFNFIANKNFNVTGMAQYSSAYDIEISDIYFVFNDSRTSLSEDKNCCISFNNSKRIIVRNCKFMNFGQHSIDLNGVQDGLVEKTSSYGGFWSSIQVDMAGGGYQAVGDNSQISENIIIRDNYITGNRSKYGAIQIHKNGGDEIFIENNTLEDVLYGITTDDYYLANWEIGENKNIYISNNSINTNAKDAIGIAIAKECSEVKIIKNKVITTNGNPLFIRGGKPDCWLTDITIGNNYLRGESIDIMGVDSGTMFENNIDLSSGKINIACEKFDFNNNVIKGYGIYLHDITVNDPRDSSNYTYTFDTLTFDGNNFSDPLGDGVTYAVEARTLRQIKFLNTGYFSADNSFDFTGMNVTSGVTIEDSK